LNLVLDPSQQTATVRAVAALDFLALQTNHSVIVPLGAGQLTAQQSAANPQVTNGAAFGGSVIVIAREPVLGLAPGTPLTLTLYGFPGTNYALFSGTNLFAISNQLAGFPLTNGSIIIPVSNRPAPATFYRALQN
jgi:hypothetical protein